MRFLSLILAGLALSAAPMAAQETATRPVQIVEVATGGGEAVRQFFGVVAARQTVDLAFQVSGTLESFEAIEGEFIPEGETVAELDLELFNLALEQARVQADQAERALERLTRLQGSAVSQVTVDDAQTSAELARIAVTGAELDLEHATLRAPFTALVAARNVANFTTISAGTPVVRLHDMSDLRIEIDVPEILFQQAGANPDIEIFAEFPAAPGEQFPVDVREFNAEASAIGQTFAITLGMAPPEDLAILPGSSATITTILRQGDPQILVPVSSVAAAPGGAPYVMVFEDGGDGTGRLEQRAIEIGAADDGTVIALSGLEAGEEIVRVGAAGLQDGQSVRRFAGFAD